MLRFSDSVAAKLFVPLYVKPLTLCLLLLAAIPLVRAQVSADLGPSVPTSATAFPVMVGTSTVSMASRPEMARETSRSTGLDRSIDVLILVVERAVRQ